jgi:antitoxin component of RelBE/YafQ-DinJ toxin-antitoxin module
MPDKEMVSAKVAQRTKKRLDRYAENEGISRSQAIGRMLKQGLDVEESDMRLVPVRSDGGTVIEDRLDQIESQQQNRLDEIDSKIEAGFEKEPSWIEQQIQAIQISSVGLGLAGAAVYLLSLANLTSIEGSLAYGLMVISAVVAFLSMVIEDVIK